MAGRLGAPNTGRVTTTSITAQGNETWQAVQDGFFRLPYKAEAVFEGARLTDPHVLGWLASTALVEGLSLSDAEVSFRKTSYFALAETLEIAETGYQQPTIAVRVPLDGVRIAESFYITRPMWRATADSVRMGDTTTYASVVIAQDIVGFLDTALTGWAVSINDALAATDDVVVRSYFRTLTAEHVQLRDRLLTTFATLALEGIQIGQSETVIRALALIDRLNIGETMLAKATLGMSLTDTVRLTDSLRRFFGGDVVEGMTVTPLLAVQKSAKPVVVDGVTLGDTLARKLVLRLTASEAVRLDDVDALKLIFRPSLRDGVEIAAAYVQPNDTVVTWAMNLHNGAVTEYRNYAFNSFAEIAPGRYIAASDSGIYELQGDTDDGDPIMAAIRSGFMQISGSRFAGFKAVYLGLRGAGDYLLKIEEGDGTTRTYKVLANSMETTKINVGKGLRARYFSFELINEDGQDFDLDTVEFVPMWAQRRV